MESRPFFFFDRFQQKLNVCVSTRKEYNIYPFLHENGVNMKNKLIQTICLLVVTLFGYTPAVGEAPGIDWFTSPSKDVTIAFLLAGQIARMPVKVGTKVKANQIVAELEDTVEQIQVEQLRLQSKNTTLVRASEAKLAQTRLDLDKFEEAYKKGAATERELQGAELEVTLARAQLDLENFKVKLAKLKYNEYKAQVGRMKLKSPTDGTVEAIMIDAGEAVDMQMEPVMRIVQIDPLWINVPVPLLQGKKLRVGGEAMVDFDFGEKETRKGKIIHVASVADPGGDTLWVRLEVPNASMRPSGETVRVRFSDKVSGRSDVKSRPSKNKSDSEKSRKEKK